MLDIKHYRELLQGEKQRTIRLLGWVDEELSDMEKAAVPDVFPDSGDTDELPDQATDTLFKELDVAFDRRYRNKLNGLEAALQRIKVGTYGRCLICGKKIDPKRLEAFPETPFCVEDARADEVQE